MQSLFEGLAACARARSSSIARAHRLDQRQIRRRLGLKSPAEALGREVEDVIPNSLMREVVRTGEPIMLDIMQFGDESFVVMRVPIKDERGA